MLKESLLGKPTEYVQTYSPEFLFPVPRSLGRKSLNLGNSLPFSEGVDIWNGFELSWLNPKGKPIIAIAEFDFPFTTPNIVESKSLKLYLNSLNQTHFSSFDDVQSTIANDLKTACEGDVVVTIIPPNEFQSQIISDFTGFLLDDLDIQTNTYQVQTSFLKTHANSTKETLYSHLLKSNCMATGQPDWGSILIKYEGKQIDREGLLKYIISFRNHIGFAEHCAEQIYCDLMKVCKPDLLSVYTRYTRRGGLDINPFRSNFEKAPFNYRQPRQ